MAKIWVVSHHSFDGSECLKAYSSKAAARAGLEKIWQEVIDAHKQEDEEYSFADALVERDNGSLEFDFGDESDFYCAEEVEMEG